MAGGRLHFKPMVRPPSETIGEDIRRTIGLAAPVIVARSGILILAVVDTVMTGRADAGELAYLGLGLAPTVSLMLVGIGMLLGTSILTAQADGAGDLHRCGEIWRAGTAHAVLLGLILLGLCQFGELFFLAIGQDAELATGAEKVVRAFGWGAPAVMVGIVTSFFLEAIQRPIAGMVIMVVANIMNFFLNWLLIFGNGPFPAMGAEGAMLATSAVRWFAAIALIAYLFLMNDSAKFQIVGPITVFGTTGSTLRRIGYPMALSQGLETSAFTASVLMAGYLGIVALSGFQIAINFVSLIFMTAIGLATAAGVRVGNAVGRQDPAGLRRAGWTAIGVTIVIMGVLGAASIVWSTDIAAFYTDDAAVIKIAATAISIAGLFLIFDGCQVVFVQSLRGTGDVWAPVILQAASFWLVGVSLGAYLAFEKNLQIAGLVSGIFIGALVAALLNGARFLVLSKREIKPL